MMQQFVETIKIKNGEALGLPFHQARMERTIRHFFPELALIAMPRLDELVEPKRDMDFYKARVVYGERGVEATEYAPYSMRTICSLKVVCDDAVDYSYKSCDRLALNALVAIKNKKTKSLVSIRLGLFSIISQKNYFFTFLLTTLPSAYSIFAMLMPGCGALSFVPSIL